MDLDGGHSPFVYIEGQRVIFDVETRSFYEFPEFKSVLVGDDQHHSLMSNCSPGTTLRYHPTHTSGAGSLGSSC